MTSIMRRTVRGAAAGMGALAIVAGTAACGDLLGGGDEGGTSTEETEEGGGDAPETAEDGSASEEGSEDTESDEETDDSQDSQESEDTGTDSEEDGEDTGAGEELSEEDLAAAGDVFFTFIQAAAEANGEGACTLITNPETGDPLEGEQLSDCAEGFEGEAEEQDIDPSMADSLDRSMIEAADNGDGTASVTMAGQDSGFTYIKADDGNWYIDGSSVL